MTTQGSLQKQTINRNTGECPFQKNCYVPTEMLAMLPQEFCCYIKNKCFFVQADLILKDLLDREESLGDLIFSKRKKRQERAKTLIKVFVSRYKAIT